VTEQERNQVLKMVAEGKITAEEGLALMQALEADESVETPELAGEESQAEAEPMDPDVDPHLGRVQATVSRLWQIPLWIGLAVTLLTAWGMYALLQGAGINFWFFCLLLLFFLGILLMAVAVGTRKARWLWIDIHQKPGEKPRRLSFAFPLPLKFMAWFFRTFGSKIDDLKETHMDEVVQVLETGFTGDQPLIVHVDEGEDGERVQVYIG